MKKLWLVLLAMALFVAPAFSAQKNLNFFWTQQLPEPNDLAGWSIYQASTAGGPYTKILDVPYVSPQAEYTATTTITVPDNATSVLYFVVDAVDKNGNRSAKSAEVAAPIDLQPPSVPGLFRIVIVSGGN